MGLRLPGSDVLHDCGPAARLRNAAQSAYEDYETADQVREELATMLSHGEPKLRRAPRAGGEHAGSWAAVFLPAVLDGLYAIHDRPRPAASRRLELLHTVPLSLEERRQVNVGCTEPAKERLSAIAALYRCSQSGLARRTWQGPRRGLHAAAEPAVDAGENVETQEHFVVTAEDVAHPAGAVPAGRGVGRCRG